MKKQMSTSLATRALGLDATTEVEIVDVEGIANPAYDGLMQSTRMDSDREEEGKLLAHIGF